MLYKVLKSWEMTINEINYVFKCSAFFLCCFCPSWSKSRRVSQHFLCECIILLLCLNPMSSFYSSTLLVYFIHFPSVMAASGHAVFRNDGEVYQGSESVNSSWFASVLFCGSWSPFYHIIHNMARESSLLIKSMLNSLFYGAPADYKPRISNNSQYLTQKVHFLLWVF